MTNKLSVISGLSKNKMLGKKKTEIEGYVEHFDRYEVKGWVVNHNKQPITLMLCIAGESFQVLFSWHERVDVAANLGDEFLESGFTLKIPPSLIEQTSAALQAGDVVEVLANNQPLINRANYSTENTNKPLLNTAQNDISGNIEFVENLELRGWVIHRALAPIELAITKGTDSYPLTPVWHDRKDVAANYGDEFIHSGFSVLIPEELIDDLLMASRQEIAVNESIFGIQANGFILPDSSQPTYRVLALLPNNCNYASLVGINARYGVAVNAKTLHDLFIGQPASTLRVSLNDTENASFYLELAKQNLAIEKQNEALKLLNIALDFAKTGQALELTADIHAKQEHYDTALSYYQQAQSEPVGTSNELFEKIEYCKQQLAQHANTPYAPIEGYIERMDKEEIHGWAISKIGEPLSVALRIADNVFSVSCTWHERADIADALGEEFLESGFTIKIPRSASSAYLAACQGHEAIDVLVNKIALVNRSKPYDPKAAVSKSTANKKRISKKIIEGNVEEINGIEISGWVVNHEKEIIDLSLVIDGAVYPVTPTWHDRPDVGEKFGSDFNKSGFCIIVPDDAVDIFVDACQYDSENNDDEERDSVVSIDVLANQISLTNKIKQSNPALSFLPANFKFLDIIQLNAQQGIFINAKDFQKTLNGKAASPIRISANDTRNANYYLELARFNLLKHNTVSARNLLKMCLAFECRAEFLELLGNTYFEQKDYETAAAHYEAAAKSEGIVSKWLFSNLANCNKAFSQSKAVVEALIDGINREPEVNFLYDRLDGEIQNYWVKQQGILEVLAITNARQALINKMAEISDFVYSAYLRAFGTEQNPQAIGSCNLQRILIVGDMHIPQCVRYRIDQKVEQLELADKEVTVISWTDLADEQNTLVFHDVIVFYRVPAEPQVLKAMAQANATGKLTLYEIDDLLFDPSYPPPIETYGGYLELNLYLQILKGMALFNAAARFCRFGIASTKPLAEKLQTLVFGKKCFVHRNGIDSHNLFKQKTATFPDKATIDIFYGSGTMAHNSDFNDLALPAIVRILNEYPQSGLMIAGYLKLPADFVKQFPGRVKLMPPVKNIKTYWSLLERADINLAVLHDDDINGCKSELKWFEAACLDIPSVVSSTANYRDVIQPGKDGLMAITSEDWYQHLKALIENPALRSKMSASAFNRVQTEYSVKALSASICKVLEQALNTAQIGSPKNRKKVALVNVFFPPQSIGGGTRVVSDNFDLLHRDYQDQFELCVFTSDAEQKPVHQMTMYSHSDARVYRSGIIWREHMDWHPSDETMGKLFSEFLLAEQPDLIHFHCVQRLGGGIIEAAVEANIPYIVTTHDAWWISDYQFLVDANNKVYPEGHPDPYEEYTPPSFTTLSESMERIIYLKDLLHKASAVLTVSETFAELYRKNEISQIQVNKNGISESISWQPKDTSYSEKVVCGHVGGMAEHKGYFLLKKAITKLQPKNIELLIVDHSHDEGYRLETHWGKVPVTFVGRLRQKRIADLYQQIDVLFAPSTWPESYGLVTREAAACGCWVIASSMGGIGEDVIEGESGFIIEPTLKAVTDSLANIDTNPTVFKSLAKATSLRSVKEQVKELVEIYRNRIENYE